MNVLIIGPSGSGKDTQSAILEEKFGFKSLSTGSILRSEVKKGSKIGKEISKYMDQGKWVPTEITYQLLGEEYSKLDSKNIIFNGVVRYPDQVKLLDNLVGLKGNKIDKVLLLNLDNKAAIERLTARGRKDDKEELIISRLNEFKESFESIIEQYNQRGILINIDASKTIEEIHKQIVKNLNL
ncbi:nucleoside monophosphate kinase [Candidatus Dojkabacteria bacterium]|uniref:Adenylate kinase n=1 Tax=Candidatus Dojkabacteria bacterium TaxID=2099670 RepID=A0A955L975_9BACT|nr:nucleoside monophosphate kinase [Candidatus Dojkabacteria bacterium]